MDSPMWWFIALIVIGIILLIFSLPVSSKQRTNQLQGKAIMMYDNNPNSNLPERWNEPEIRTSVERFIKRHHDQPNLLAYYMETLRTRFIDRQDQRVQEQRTKYLESLIKNLAASKEAATLLYELRRVDLVQETEDLKAQSAYDRETMIKKDTGEITMLEGQLRKEKLQSKIAKQQHKREKFSGKKSQEEKQMDEARDRVKRDIKWKMENKVLRNVTTLSEIQRIEREETQRILTDRSLSPQEQMERLDQLRRDCEEAKRQLNQDTNPFEDD